MSFQCMRADEFMTRKLYDRSNKVSEISLILSLCRARAPGRYSLDLDPTRDKQKKNRIRASKNITGSGSDMMTLKSEIFFSLFRYSCFSITLLEIHSKKQEAYRIYRQLFWIRIRPFWPKPGPDPNLCFPGRVG